MLDLKSLVPWGRKSDNVPVNRETRHDPFVSFRSEIDRVFDDFFHGGFGLARPGYHNGMSTLSPQLDVSESDKELTIMAELAGVDEKDLDVTLIGDVLTIKGEKKHEKEETNGDRKYVERYYGSFSRSVGLPFEAGDQDVSANMKNGVLTIKVPKPKDFQSKAKRIEIAAS